MSYGHVCLTREAFIDFFFFLVMLSCELCQEKKTLTLVVPENIYLDMSCWLRIGMVGIKNGPFSCQNTVPPQKLNCLGKQNKNLKY